MREKASNDDTNIPRPEEGRKIAVLGLSHALLKAAIADKLGAPPTTRDLVVTAVNPPSETAEDGVQTGDIGLSTASQSSQPHMLRQLSGARAGPGDRPSFY